MKLIYLSLRSVSFCSGRASFYNVGVTILMIMDYVIYKGQIRTKLLLGIHMNSKIKTTLDYS